MSRTAIATSAQSARETPSPGSRSNTSRVAGPISSTPSVAHGADGAHCAHCAYSSLLYDEPPLRHMYLERGLLPQPRQPRSGLDHRIHDRARPVVHRFALDPLRCVGGEVLLEERRRLHAVGPAFAGHGPTRHMRDHRRRDLDVVVDHLPFRRPGLRIEHLVQVARLHSDVTEVQARDAADLAVPRSAPARWPTSCGTHGRPETPGRPGTGPIRRSAARNSAASAGCRP